MVRLLTGMGNDIRPDPPRWRSSLHRGSLENSAPTIHSPPIVSSPCYWDCGTGPHPLVTFIAVTHVVTHLRGWTSCQFSTGLAFALTRREPSTRRRGWGLHREHHLTRLDMRRKRDGRVGTAVDAEATPSSTNVSCEGKHTVRMQLLPVPERAQGMYGGHPEMPLDHVREGYIGYGPDGTVTGASRCNAGKRGSNLLSAGIMSRLSQQRSYLLGSHQLRLYRVTPADIIR